MISRDGVCTLQTQETGHPGGMRVPGDLGLQGQSAAALPTTLRA